LSAFIAPCKKKGLEREVEGYRLHLEEMVAERTHQIEAALKLVERSYEDTLEALGAAIDLRDAATEGHSRRVCRFATSDRPYRSALPFEEGFRVIHSESGRLFDPQITGAFFSIPRKPGPRSPGISMKSLLFRLGCAAAALSPRSLHMSPVGGANYLRLPPPQSQATPSVSTSAGPPVLLPHTQFLS
jgi:hypothetical protein